MMKQRRRTKEEAMMEEAEQQAWHLVDRDTDLAEVFALDAAKVPGVLAEVEHVQAQIANHLARCERLLDVLMWRAVPGIEPKSHRQVTDYHRGRAAALTSLVRTLPEAVVNTLSLMKTDMAAGILAAVEWQANGHRHDLA